MSTIWYKAVDTCYYDVRGTLKYFAQDFIHYNSVLKSYNIFVIILVIFRNVSTLSNKESLSEIKIWDTTVMLLFRWAKSSMSLVFC